MKKNPLLLLLSGLVLSCLFLITCSKTKSGKPIYVTDCADSLVGVYSGSDNCSATGSASYTSSITAATPANITFTYLGQGTNVTAVVDCSTNTITIPSQTFPGNFSISGTGTFTANRIIINWSGLSLGSPVSCSSVFTR